MGAEEECDGGHPFSGRWRGDAAGENFCE